jgi:hypothetical protein
LDSCFNGRRWRYSHCSVLRILDQGGSSQQTIDIKSKFYRGYLYGLATIPMIGLWIGFAQMQKFYAIIGALFMPMLALTLLLLNGRASWIGDQHRNHLLTTMTLIFILLFFLMAGGLTVQKILG